MSEQLDIEIVALRARIKVLEAALEPFARVACIFDPDRIGTTMPRTGPWQSWPRTENGETVFYDLTVEHLRAAREAKEGVL